MAQLPFAKKPFIKKFVSDPNRAKIIFINDNIKAPTIMIIDDEKNNL